MARMKNLFPKMTRGCYSVNIRFLDEGRGERYFDSYWVVTFDSHNTAGEFAVRHLMAHDGRALWDAPAANSIGRDLRVGDTVVLQPVRWTQTRRRFMPGSFVEITGVEIREHDVLIRYAYPKPKKLDSRLATA